MSVHAFASFAESTRPYPVIGESDCAFYAENGYLTVDGALYADEVEALRAETTALCRGDRGAIRGVTPADPQDEDAEVLKRYLCIHFPHKLSPLMLDYLAHPVIVDVLTKVIGANVKAMQSMLFIKAAGKPGQAWHQDEIYIPTRDRSLTGGWIALDDATVENGCLWVIPGSHKHGILWPQHHHDDRRFDCSEETIGFPYRDEDAIPVEVKAGAVVFFNGYLLHRSLPNRARSGYRRVLVNHYMSAESLLPWHNPRAGERMATADMRDIVMIAGSDPYAFKGIEDVAQPHIRPDGQGGCGDPRQNVRIESRETSALPYDDDADED
ncbi:MAG: phytanoyl-CoA dioxygenase family protein [Anaerolineae bacterium]|nr:phytanoyl-CoA dioxygenase family protein [Anaerolineae bacterium]